MPTKERVSRYEQSLTRRRRNNLRRFLLLVAAGACLLGSLLLYLQDDQLRRPDTDDGPGDPPTKYLDYAKVSGICGVGLVAVLIGSEKGRKKWMHS